VAAASVPPVTTLAVEESTRAQRDPDYRWLVSDIAAIDSVRGQHSVSLNLKTRREERTRIDTERLARENSRRAAKNLPPVKTIEELDKVTKDEAADVVLEQATQVMADMVSQNHAGPPTKTARTG
jgi:carboxyl-terminal processing protease